MNTQEFAQNIQDGIGFTVRAHMHHAKTPNDTVRFFDKKTPYIIHPIWCAMTILAETTLPEEFRIQGYQALLWHDVLEDTKLDLPEDISPEVVLLVNEMTFSSFEEETRKIWDKREEVRLLKLYDKTSNLLDGTWMKADKWNNYVEFTSRLANEALANYGELNIVKIARSLCVRR